MLFSQSNLGYSSSSDCTNPPHLQIFSYLPGRSLFVTRLNTSIRTVVKTLNLGCFAGRRWEICRKRSQCVNWGDEGSSWTVDERLRISREQDSFAGGFFYTREITFFWVWWQTLYALFYQMLSRYFIEIYFKDDLDIFTHPVTCKREYW